MAVQLDDVLKALQSDEVDYEQARLLGPAAIPFLRQLVSGRDEMMAAKATYLAGLIGTAAGGEVVNQAAGRPQLTIRVAAAAAARELEADLAAPILLHLLADADRGVRNRALQSAGTRITPDVQAYITKMTSTDPDKFIRQRASETLDRTHP
jgi:HEAT repeat protein